MSFEHDFAGGFLRATCSNAIGTLTIDNPDRKNAMSAAMWRAVPQAIRLLTDKAQAHVIIIRGAGQDFSTGADISEFDSLRKDAETAVSYEALNSSAFTAIRHCRVPTIAAIRGICYGGGFGIAAACDLRVAAEGARFSVPAVRLGIAYPADAVQDIVNALGPQMAKVTLFTGAPMSAGKMVAAGFLLEEITTDAFDDEVSALARAIAANAPIALHASKLAVRAVIEQDSDLLREAEVIGAETFDSADYAEGRAAFAARRKPQFTGK
ncbi:enoyl-CoA hydratase-related protein [Rhizobium leucaenae]|uniref:Enoyl-CoA hydratase/carnithine racemase n=1 Tax=Rhizobium leucaenae TaxID=29450 RepID=A0A7W6ZWZ0_9HYPH|nr:enoyl-CoA hydratase-related protein [Rhizobium leucaenae]MBB4569683.1 enoyl-CoA hydratase/carnithine racemase [Rhizobium leucaenae]MBB6304411.1 enoyl-CoA hydratase/carnithine racemase [Rhizobium leucaenae]